jgi:hypothetical protein
MGTSPSGDSVPDKESCRIQAAQHVATADQKMWVIESRPADPGEGQDHLTPVGFIPAGDRAEKAALKV